LSFGVYFPFDNDPYGIQGARGQTPGFELFMALLAMGSHVKLGVLAQSGLMVPMAALIIFTGYRLGLTLAGDTAGGMAAMLLLFTTIFRRAAGMRGTAVDFALIALGLAFFFDRRRSRALTILGALILGASIPTHAIDGTFAMMVAGVGALLWLAAGDSNRFVAGVICLVGAGLFGLPELAIGLGRAVPFPLMPLSQFAGIALILFGAGRLNESKFDSAGMLPRLAKAMVCVLIVTIIYFNASGRNSIYEQVMTQFPILFIFMLMGLIVWAAADDSATGSFGLAIAVFALLLGATNQFLGSIVVLSGNGVFQSAVSDIGYKVEEYWTPYFLVFPAAILFAMLYDLNSRRRLVVVLGMLVMLIYPWLPRYDTSYDYNEHSVSEEWGIGLSPPITGNWDGTTLPRWTMTPTDFALTDFLRKEQASGRITTDTHVLHIAHDASVGGDFCRFPVFTGIDDDPVVPQVEDWFKGSRVRPLSELREALARNYPYILEQVSPPPWVKDPPDGYEQVFHQGPLRLFRRKQ